MKLEMTQKQELKLTPQMLQSMELLQMSAQELEAYLQELVQENPAAELSGAGGAAGRGGGAWRRMQSLADQDNQNRQYVAAEREELDPLARIGTDGGLEDTPSAPSVPAAGGSQAPTLVLRGAQFWQPVWTSPVICGRKWKTWPRRPDCLPRCWREG